jgi:hypothetical protein
MTTISTPFPTAMCEASFVAEMRSEGDANGHVTPEPGQCGYSLMNGKLVPMTFKDRVADQLMGANIDYGYVLGKEDIFDADFLARLDVNEHDVLMLVVLELVALGEFPLNLWAPRVHDYEWESTAE